MHDVSSRQTIEMKDEMSHVTFFLDSNDSPFSNGG